MATALTDGYMQTALGKGSIGSDVSILKCCHVLWGHKAPISCLSFSSDLDVVVSGSTDGVVCVHTVRQGEFVRSLDVKKFLPSDGTGKDFNLTAIKMIALDNHGTFVTHLEDFRLQMYTINGLKLASVDAGERLHALEMVPGGDMVVTGGESCNVVIRSLSDLSTRCILDFRKCGQITCISLTSTELNPAPQFMYVGTSDGSVTIVNRDNSESSYE